MRLDHRNTDIVRSMFSAAFPTATFLEEICPGDMQVILQVTVGDHSLTLWSSLFRFEDEQDVQQYASRLIEGFAYRMSA